MHDANICIKQFLFFLLIIEKINLYNYGEQIHIHIILIDDDAVKKVGVYSISLSKAQNVFYVKCNVRR
jgi:hypothetical protein